MEAALAILSLRSGKDLPDPYKDHPLHKSSIYDETPTVVVEQDSNSSDDEEKWVRAEPILTHINHPCHILKYSVSLRLRLVNLMIIY